MYILELPSGYNLVRRVKDHREPPKKEEPKKQEDEEEDEIDLGYSDTSEEEVVTIDVDSPTESE